MSSMGLSLVMILIITMTEDDYSDDDNDHYYYGGDDDDDGNYDSHIIYFNSCVPNTKLLVKIGVKRIN